MASVSAAPARTFIRPSVDLMVRLMLLRSPRLLRSMLEAVLQPPEPLGELETLDADVPPETVLDKGVVLDVRARLSDGRQVDIEVQSVVRRDLPARVLFYWARLYAGTLRRGDDYGTLRPVVVIVWALATVFPEARAFHSIFEVRERSSGRRLSDQLELHLLEVPHAPVGPSANPALLRWSAFLAARDQADLDRLAEEDPIMAEARDVHQALSDDPRTEAMLRERDRLLEAARVMEATYRDMLLREGRAEGLREGLEQGLERGLEQGLEQGLRDGLEQGLRDGLEQGRAALAAALLAQCDVRFGPLDPATRERISAASAPELHRLLGAMSVAEVVATLAGARGER